MTKLTQLLPQNSQLEHEKFNNVGKVHDWRNYVGEFVDCWSELTPRERQIIFVMANEQASKEEWD